MGGDSSFPAELGYTMPTIIGSVTGNTAGDRARAVRAIAAHARDVTDCADLLAMLDLHPREGLSEQDTSDQQRSGH